MSTKTRTALEAECEKRDVATTDASGKKLTRLALSAALAPAKPDKCEKHLRASAEKAARASGGSFEGASPSSSTPAADGDGSDGAASRVVMGPITESERNRAREIIEVVVADRLAKRARRKRDAARRLEREGSPRPAGAAAVVVSPPSDPAAPVRVPLPLPGMMPAMRWPGIGEVVRYRHEAGWLDGTVFSARRVEGSILELTYAPAMLVKRYDAAIHPPATFLLALPPPWAYHPGNPPTMRRCPVVDCGECREASV